MWNKGMNVRNAATPQRRNAATPQRRNAATRVAAFLSGAINRSRFVLPLLVLGAILSPTHAQTPAWQFNPRRIGSALTEGGWMVSRPIATVNGSPEFTFPLELVYLSNRTQRGGFGGKWFCPQLEGSLIPKARGVLAWTQPSGGVIGLVAGENKQSVLADQRGEWRAKITGALTVISNPEGWQYSYRSGRPVSIQAPSGRQLEFACTGTNLTSVTLRDPATGVSRLLVTLVRQTNDRVAEIHVGGTTHRFSYENGRDGDLATWLRPGAPKADAFEYEKKSGLLTTIQAGIPGAERLRFLSEIAKGKDGKPLPENDPANYRLIADSNFKYSYEDRKGAVGRITIADNNGGTQSLDYAANRGLEISRDAAGIETRTYFYRAPGRKHDGKLRRIERGGQTIVDNFYDRITGNLIESRDQNGVSTFYEYDPRTAGNPLLAGKPLAIYSGTRKKKELVATMKYDSAGRLTERSDSSRQAARCTYNSRGALESVVNASGKRTTLTYDSFGRLTGVADGDQRHTAEYDDQGRVKSRKLPDGQTVEYLYDSVGQLEKTRQNGIVVSASQRDPAGRFVIQTDAIGRPTWSEFDAKGNVIAEHQANGSTTWYACDALGHRTAQIDGNGNKISFDYDKAGRMTKQVNPLAQTLTWE
jgi:YD repeat-containing protein